MHVGIANRFVKTSPSLVLLAFASALISPALAADKTARALLPQVQAEAKKWEADSVLVNIDTGSASRKGTAPMWTYSFYSPATKKKTLFAADGTSPPSRADSIYFRTNPVGEFAVDSDQAMVTAIGNGLAANDYGMRMSLESNKGKPEWRMVDKTHFYYVDAAGGKFLRKEKTD